MYLIFIRFSSLFIGFSLIFIGFSSIFSGVCRLFIGVCLLFIGFSLLPFLCRSLWPLWTFVFIFGLSYFGTGSLIVLFSYSRVKNPFLEIYWPLFALIKSPFGKRNFIFFSRFVVQQVLNCNHTAFLHFFDEIVKIL